MASNDSEPIDEPNLPKAGPVAFLTRLVHIPAANDQTPVRIACVLLLAVAVTAAPVPINVVGSVALIVLALSLGRITPIK